ncbi:MAG TPA: TIGR03118 family protein [Steroidobacteraceae bacterium]
MNAMPAPMHKVSASVVLGLMCCTALAHDDDDSRHRQQPAYSNHVLVSNGGVPADFTDPNLVNAWGVAFNPQGFVWVNDADAGKSTLYDGTGKPQALVVTVPGPGGAMGHPTGIVFSGGADFVISKTTPTGTLTGPARFIFATEDGTIAAWAPNVDAVNALTIVPNTTQASYKGLALGGTGITHLLYAANFHLGRVDVFDSMFQPTTVPGGFVDRNLPAGYAPFGIQAINGDIYVTFAKQDAAADEEVAGPGRGFVDVFDANGHLIDRVASRGALNAPWGLALAPKSFGEFGGALLVGNFGDGTINAYGPISGRFLGTLQDRRGRRLHIDGLWGIAFGNGIAAQPTNSLFYASGPHDEEDGAYGVVESD